MAKVEIKMPEDFLLRLSRLGDQTDTIIPKVLEAGGEIVEAKVKVLFRLLPYGMVESTPGASSAESLSPDLCKVRKAL